MTTQPLITIDICPGAAGQPPMVRLSAQTDNHPNMVGGVIKGGSDTAMVARAMLTSAAYLFAQGQPVKFGPEVPLEVLK
jgi:hypothetical protein